MSALALACALALALAPPHAQGASEAFAREVYAALASGDEERVAAIVRASPTRAATLALELAGGALAGDGAQGRFDDARRIAALISEQPRLAWVPGAVERYAPGRAEARAARRGVDAAHEAALEAARGGELERARGLAQEALAQARALDDPCLAARERRFLGELLRDLGRLDQAEDEVAAALATHRRLGLDPPALQDLLVLGRLAFRRGEYRAALERLAEARDLALALGEPELAPSAELGALHANLGEAEPARALLDEALVQARARGDRGSEAYALAALGALEGSLGRYDAALRALVEAVALARAQADPLGEARVLVQLGGLHAELGRVREAEDALEGALELAGEGPRAAQVRVHALLALALARLDGGRAAAALAPVDEALGLLDAAQHADARADALQLRARALLALERAAQAEPLLREALALRERSGAALGRASARVELGDVLERLGREAEARGSWSAALAAAEALDLPEVRWRARAGLARAAERAGDSEGALAQVQAALDDVEGLRRLLGAPALRRRFLDRRLEVYRSAARLLARRGELIQAFRWSDAVHARTLLELGAAGGMAGATPSPEERALREVEARVALVERQLTQARSAGGPTVELQARREALRREHAQARLALELADPRRAVLLGIASRTELDAVRAALAPGAALVEYLCGPSACAAFVVRRERASFHELEADAGALERLAARLRRPAELLRAGRTDVANLGFDVRAARELHRLLIEPLAGELDGCELLWLVPDGPLRGVPFAALVRAWERRAVDPARLYAQYEGCRFLVEDFALGQLPAAGILCADPARGAPDGMVAVADPQPLPDGGVALAGARAEAREVLARAGDGPARLLEGSAATEAAVAQELARAGLALLATHALVDDQRPSWSRLALAPAGDDDGWLHAFEVEGLALPGTRVVLSSCESLEQASAGEGLLGLARAFLQAGASSVVGTLWVAEDAASARLIGAYARHLAAGQEGPRALALAQRGLLRGTSSRPLWTHPFFWAGHVWLGAR